MNREQFKAAAVARLGREDGWQSAIARKLGKDARTIRRWTHENEKDALAKITEIEKEATAILTDYGAGDVDATRDPRGAGMTFRLRSSVCNGFESGRWEV